MFKIYKRTFSSAVIEANEVKYVENKRIDEIEERRQRNQQLSQLGDSSPTREDYEGWFLDALGGDYDNYWNID